MVQGRRRGRSSRAGASSDDAPARKKRASRAITRTGQPPDETAEAEHLAADGYAVAGFDVKRFLASLLSDLMNAGEPREAGSFSVPDQLTALPPAVRVAIVRGQRDEYRYADSALVAAGGARVERFAVPFAGHSLKKLLFAGPAVDHAMDYLVPPANGTAGAGR